MKPHVSEARPIWYAKWVRLPTTFLVLAVLLTLAAWSRGDARAEPDVSGEVAAVRVGSLTQAVEQVGAVTLQSRNMALPGLGSWTIDIDYEASIVEPTSCSGLSGGICNATYGANTVRAVGAIGSGGLTGNRDLASLAFRCLAEGASALQITVHVLADGTSGDPQPISAAVEHGTILCVEQAVLVGDASCDGEVSAVDAALILQLDAGLIDSVPCPENADVNNDGQINAIDAALILQYVAGLLDEL